MNPTLPGIYAAEVYHGWKLLEWKEGAWFHPDLVARWTLEVVQWVGPLPERQGVKPKVEYDL